MAKKKFPEALKIALIILLVIALVIPIILFAIVLLPWLLFQVFTHHPPAPEITYAEFPFSLTYRIGSETITVNDTYVCEFAGFNWDTGNGYYINWNGYVKETGLSGVLIVEDDDRQIFCKVGDARYYMEGPNSPRVHSESLSPPHIYPKYKKNDYNYVTTDQIKQIYDIEIISWEFSEPLN